MGAGTTQKVVRGSRNTRRGHKPMSEINVTPFVDVMLVLLIIFMVAAPLLTAGVEIDLPNTAAKALPSEEKPLTLQIAADGELYLQDTLIEIDELLPKLKAISFERENDKIFFKADKANIYDHIMKVLGVLSRAGFTNIAMVTDTD